MDPSIDASNQYSNDENSATSPAAESYQYNSSTSSITNLHNLTTSNSPSDSNSNDSSAKQNYYNISNYPSYPTGQYYINMDKTNQQFYNPSIISNYHQYYGMAAAAAASNYNYYSNNNQNESSESSSYEIESNKLNEHQTNTSIISTKSKTDENEENEIDNYNTNKRQMMSNNTVKNKKQQPSVNQSSSYLMQPPDSESIAVAAANASANRCKRRTRTKFDKRQLDALEAAFERAHYPDVNQIICLSEMLNISTERISVWFQNRRARFKRSKKDVGPTSNNNNHLSLELQIKSILDQKDENEDYDEEEDDIVKNQPIKTANLSCSKKNQPNQVKNDNLVDNIRKINDIESQLSCNQPLLIPPIQNLPVILPKPHFYHPSVYHHQFSHPYNISSLTNENSQLRLPIKQNELNNSDNLTPDSSSSQSVTPSPSKASSSDDTSRSSSVEQRIINAPNIIYPHNNNNSYQCTKFTPYPTVMLGYSQNPQNFAPSINLTTPNGSISQLTRQYHPTIGHIFQPFIDRSNINKDDQNGPGTGYLASTLNNRYQEINSTGVSSESNSNSPSINTNRSRTESPQSDENKKNENIDNNKKVQINDEEEDEEEEHDYDEDESKEEQEVENDSRQQQFNNDYSQILSHNQMYNTHFLNQIGAAQHQQQQQQGYNNYKTQSYNANLPGINQIFQPFANSNNINSNEQVNDSYY